MAKRVLGNDPFADDKGNGKTAEASTRASKRPPSKAPAKGPSKPSVRPPTGKPSVKPSAESKPARERGVLPASVEPEVETVMGQAETMLPEVPKAPRVASIEPEMYSEPDDEHEGATATAYAPPIVAADEEAAAPAPPSVTPARGEVRDEIRDLEAELDRLLEQVAERGGSREALDRVAERLRAHIGSDSAEHAVSPSEAPRPPAREDQNVFDVARELLSSDYYLRQWGRVAMRDRSEVVDEFGLDPKFEARVRTLMDFLYEHWWRIEAHDIERVPASGRVILCANHSGALPYDGAMLATALRREHPTRRELRWLAEDFVFHFPFLGVFMNRIGAVRACQENAERLLNKASCVGVFPEGVKGISKPYRDRYRLQRFGRGGHVKLAIRTRTPIVPVAILGAEEAHPLIAPMGMLTKVLGLPFVPVTPTFPWLGPLGLMPLPAKWKIFFLDPIPMDGYAPDAADDDVLVGRLNEKIRGLIQEELDRALRERRSVWRG